jgi:hypothetical protein
MLSSQFYLPLPNNVFPLHFPTEIRYAFIHPMRATSPTDGNSGCHIREFLSPYIFLRVPYDL